MADLFNQTGAIFSPCKKYRFLLWRIWDESKPMVMFIGLNPSTANETKPDPTITRVKHFAAAWGFGGVYMTNLFAYVTPYPEQLQVIDDPQKENDEYLNYAAARSAKIVFAWGSFEVMGRDKEMLKMFPNAEALIINKDGSPRHPLYVKGDVVLKKFVTSCL